MGQVINKRLKSRLQCHGRVMWRNLQSPTTVPLRITTIYSRAFDNLACPIITFHLQCAQQANKVGHNNAFKKLLIFILLLTFILKEYNLSLDRQ